MLCFYVDVDGGFELYLPITLEWKNVKVERAKTFFLLGGEVPYLPLLK